ncbi:MAG: hypothetical protein MUP98_20075 [Candidatus Aminicenantes bacterium]|nr:hypothetical protein [Candidatus Aminicenantes bacterium]
MAKSVDIETLKELLGHHKHHTLRGTYTQTMRGRGWLG